MNESKLTPQQQLFVKYYTTRGDTFNHGTLSYSLAYEHELPTDENGKIIVDSKVYNMCKSNASRLLLNDNVRKQIQENMVALLNDTAVDERLTEILFKGQEQNSIQAIKIHNDLKQRITKKLDITSAGRPLQGLSDEELKQLAGE